MKLHDLRPAPGSHKPKRRVGRGIAAGQGKTAGRGTKGQKARAGGNIPAWFEGGQTPLHQRLPKLRGFRNPFKTEYEVVNLGDIARLVELGVLEGGELPTEGGKATKTSKAKGAAPVTVNQEILRAAGLVRTLDRPLKVLGNGELSTALFVVADAYSASARAKIEAAGGTANVIEVPGAKKPALRMPAAEQPTAAAAGEAAPVEAAATDEAPAPKARGSKAKAAAQTEPADDAMAQADEATPAAADATPSDDSQSEATPSDDSPSADAG